MIYPGEETKLYQCTVQSVFGYFENDFNNFNRSGVDGEGFIVNYMTRMKSCAQ